MELTEENTCTFRVVFREGPQNTPITIQQGAYNLIIDPDRLSLLSITSNEIILEWPYACIKRYGVSPNCFKIDLGRRSRTGEGMYVMETTKGRDILDKIIAMSKQITDECGLKTKTSLTGNLNTEHTRKDETLGRGVSELIGKLCQPPGGKTTTFTDTPHVDEYIYDDGEVLATPGASAVLDEGKHGEPARSGSKNEWFENSTEQLGDQDSGRKVPGRVGLFDLSKKERSRTPRRDYENVKFLRK
ncbi:uncharacterized protein [Haliotis asinina]|uniref:uncharacterized protein n=1 Tax=Haliotis asinina TaxID=109174 RepID=UPI003532551E